MSVVSSNHNQYKLNYFADVAGGYIFCCISGYMNSIPLRAYTIYTKKNTTLTINSC